MWKPAAREGHLFPGEACVIRIGYEEVALYNVDGRYYATGNRCPHQGGSLGEGYLEGGRIVCPMHGWEFRVDSGEAACPGQPGSIRTYATKVEDGQVWVDLPEL